MKVGDIFESLLEAEVISGVPVKRSISTYWIKPDPDLDDTEHGFQTRIEQVSGLFDRRNRFGTHSKGSMPIFSSQEAF